MNAAKPVDLLQFALLIDSKNYAKLVSLYAFTKIDHPVM